MSVAQTIKEKLNTALSPAEIRVVDESANHEGHGGWRPGGETHFRVEIVAAAFAGKSRVACHRMITDLLDEELAGPVHALAIQTATPE